MKSFLKLEPKAGEDLASDIINESNLVKLLDNLYDSINDTEAVEIHVYRRHILIGTRKKGHGDRMVKKFTNYGFSPEIHDGKSVSLTFAIRAIDDGNLPDYCYKAIQGDVEALRLTTEHLVRAYDAKIRRMQEKKKDPKEIEQIVIKKNIAAHRLRLADRELTEVSEPIIIELPKNPDVFYGDGEDEEVVIADQFDENFWPFKKFSS